VADRKGGELSSFEDKVSGSKGGERHEYLIRQMREITGNELADKRGEVSYYGYL